MDNYLTGYPVLVFAALEVIGIGWIYGVKKFRKDLKLMRGKYPSVYWTICYSVLTPIFTIVRFFNLLVKKKFNSLLNY